MKKASLRAEAAPSAAPATPRSWDSVVEGLGEETRWARKAEGAIAAFARRGAPFTSSDLVNAVGAPPSSSLLPALVRAAHRRGLIVRDESAPLGTVWVGASPDSPTRRAASARLHEDRRRATPVDAKLWRAVLARAERENIGTDEVLARALRAYLASRQQ